MICQKRYPEMGSLYALHLCGNKRCIRPSHIVPGTQKENMAHKELHGTIPKGEACYNSKLTEEDVINIRWSLKSNEELAQVYGVCPQTISEIQLNKIWKHVKF